MNPDKVDRTKLERLTDLPNIGPAIAADLRLIGIERSNDLAGQSPLELYHMLSTIKALSAWTTCGHLSRILLCTAIS